MRYRDEKFYWTYQRGVHWPNDYIGPDSMTCWIIEKSDGFTDVGLYKISESVEIVKCGFWRKLPLLPLLWHSNAVDEN